MHHQNSQPPRSSEDTTITKSCEKMVQIAYLSSGTLEPIPTPPPPPQKTPPSPPRQQHSVLWPRDEILCSLLAAAAAKQQHTPIAPSPLNPTLCESDLILGRHISQLRRTRPGAATRRPPEISPTLRFLKRKAYFEYQAHNRQAHHRGGPGAGAEESSNGGAGSADETDCGMYVEGGEEDRLPEAFIVESGPLLHVVQFGYARHDLAADVEKQMVAHRPLPRWQNPQQRLKFFFILCFMSACLTILTVVSLGALKSDRYFPG